MYNSWYDVFPEIVMISDKELQKKVVETYEEALKTGGWQLNDIDTINTLYFIDTGYNDQLQDPCQNGYKNVSESL